MIFDIGASRLEGCLSETSHRRFGELSMSLIEQLGGYENAKKRLKRDNVLNDEDFNYGQRQLLEYRRQYNIFEEGDLVIDTNYKDSDVQEVKSVNWNKIEVFHKNKAYYFATYIFSFRHASDAEIKAGKRLEILNESE